MEHTCAVCSHWWGDNTVAVYCPNCGSKDVSNEWDEAHLDPDEFDEFKEQLEDD